MSDTNSEMKERIEAMRECMVPPLTSQCCIRRVPRKLRSVNEAAYTPHVISIGPFHHNKDDQLQYMEKQKVRYLDHYVGHLKVSLDKLLAFVKNNESKIRQSYGEHIDQLSSDDLVIMVLLDGLFIIEYFRRCYYAGLKNECDKILYTTQLSHDIRHDLILIENQLPFFILESLYKHLYPFSTDHEHQSKHSFLTISCEFFSYYNQRKMTPSAKVLHFTDLIRTFQIPSSLRLKPSDVVCDNKTLALPRSAKELDEAGVTFEVIPSKCLFDIEFAPKSGVIQLPQLVIYDSAESFYRNLMALEQYQYWDEPYICDYILFLGELLKTNKDAKLLTREGIISNHAGDHDALTALFNNFGREIMCNERNSYFYRIKEDLDDYYKKPWHKYRAALKREYFNSPWQIASVIVATILLILTLVQTVNSF